MNKIFKHKILAGAMLLGFMLSGTSCQEVEGVGGAVTDDRTLYDLIKSDPELTEFVKVLDACGPECADSLFNHSRVYTLWAPVNSDSWSADELIAQMGGENKPQRDVVFRSFIQAHIANNLVPANGTLADENNILLLNGKNAIFEGSYKDGGNYYFSGKKLKDRNIRVKNGILHKIGAPSEYKYSIWEYMKIAKGEDWSIDNVRTFLESFSIREFNEGLSIPGAIVNGQQTYIDSVYITRNDWLSTGKGVGYIDNEDSTYIVYVPSDKMWERMVTMAESHFKYDTESSSVDSLMKLERDSLRNYYARFHNLKYMTYSVNEQRHVDSVGVMMPIYRSTKQYSNGSWAKRPLFPTEELNANVVHEMELSNGIFKVVDAMPYTALDLWHDTVSIEAEKDKLWDYKSTTAKVVRVTQKQINQDDPALEGAKLSGDHYYDETNAGTTNQAVFKIPKLLSAKYQVAAVFVPKNIVSDLNVGDLEAKTKFTVTISQGAKTLLASKTHYVNAHGLNTVYLTIDGTVGGKRLEFTPLYCEYIGDGDNANDYSLKLQVMSQGPTLQDKKNGVKVDTSFRIDKFLFIPVLDSEE